MIKQNKKIIGGIFLVVLLLSFVSAEVNTSIMYGENSSGAQVPLAVDSDGKLEVNLDLLNITAGDITSLGNFSLGEKITFALGEIIDNIQDGWIRVTGNLNVTTGNFSLGGKLLTNDNGTLRWGGDDVRNNISVLHGVNDSGSAVGLSVDNSGILNMNVVGVASDIFSRTGNVVDLVTKSNDFAINNSNLFIDTSAGKVGIGTSTPTEKLNVVGNVNITQNLSVGHLLDVNTGTVSASSFQTGPRENIAIDIIPEALFITRTDSNNIETVIPALGLTSYGSDATSVGNRVRLAFYHPQEGAAGTDVISSTIDAVLEDGVGSYAEKSNIAFNTRTAGTSPGDGLTERMRITYDGKVGIGTTSPGAKLEVVGSVNATNYNGMIVHTATGTVADVTDYTQIAAFQLSDRATFKLIIGSDIASNTVGVNEYVGSTGGVAGYVNNIYTYRSHAWEAYYQVTVGSNDIVNVTAKRGSDNTRLSVYKILLTSY